MHLSKPFKMLVAIFTSITFLATSLGVSPGAFAAPATPEVSLPYQAIIDRDLGLSIPEELGKLERFNPGAGEKPAIFHIQTAHGHYEAQQQIRQILHYLEKQYGVTTLLVEGSAFQLNPKLLNFFPNDPALTQKVNDELTKRALVKGPELYLMDKLGATTETKSLNVERGTLNAPKAYGIENLKTYRENGLAFVDVLNQKEKTTQFLSDMDLEIDRLASRMLNKELRDFLRRVDSFEKSRIPLDLWLKDLKDEAQKNLEIDLASPAEQLDWPMMVRFFKMQELVAKFDSRKFPEEREDFLKAVKRFLPVSLNGEIERFLMSDQMSRQLSDPETGLLFEDMVKRLPGNFNYDAFPNVRLFIGILLLQSELKADRLFAETKTLSSKIAEKLTRNQGEKQLIELLADHRLLQKLFSLELMPEDYETILARSVERGVKSRRSLKPSDIVRCLSDYQAQQSLRAPFFGARRSLFSKQIASPASRLAMTAREIEELDALYEKAMKFYAGVKERDGAMEQRIEERLRETGVNKVAVITGGFHSRPFMDHFSAKHCTYALISPKLTSSDDAGHAVYENNILRFAEGGGRMEQIKKQGNVGRTAKEQTPSAILHPVIAAQSAATRESEFLSDPQMFAGAYAINAGALRSEVRKIIREVIGRKGPSLDDGWQKADGEATEGIRRAEIRSDAEELSASPSREGIIYRGKHQGMRSPKTVEGIFKRSVDGDREALAILGLIAKYYSRSITRPMRGYLVRITSTAEKKGQGIARQALKSLDRSRNAARVTGEFLEVAHKVFEGRTLRGFWKIRKEVRDNLERFVQDPALYELIHYFFTSKLSNENEVVSGVSAEILQMLETAAVAKAASKSLPVRSESRVVARWIHRGVVFVVLVAVMGLTACALPRGQQPSSVPTPGITPAEIRKSLEVRPPVMPRDSKPPAPSMPKIPSVHRRSEIRSGPTLVDVAVGGGITLGIFFLILAFNPFSQKSEQIAPRTGQPSIDKTVTISQHVVDEQRSQAVEAAVRAGRQGQFVTVMWATNATAEWKGARPDQLESQTGKIALWKGRVLLTIQDGQMFSIPLTSVWDISIVGTPPSGPNRSEMRDSEGPGHQNAASFQGRFVNLLKVLKGSAVLVALAGLVGCLWDINMFAWLFPALGNMNPSTAANVLVASLSVSVALGACMIGGAIKNEQERVGREAMEKALADNESMHRERAALSPVGIFEADLSGVVDYANDMALLIFGYTQEDVAKGMKVLELLAPEDRDRGQRRLGEILKNGENGGMHATGEYSAVRKDGTPFPISINTKVRFKDGKPVGFRGVITDITERKAAEKALAARKAELKASHALLSSVTEHAPGAIYQFKMSPEGHFSLPYGNANFTHAFGIAPKDLEADASGIFNSIHSEDRRKILSTIRESARTMGLWSQEFRVVLPDGTLAWRSARSRPAKLEDGSIVWHGFVMDITERKKAEEKLKESQELLRRQDRLSTLEMLIAGVTHELNNPIAIMLGLGELMGHSLASRNTVEAEQHLGSILENLRNTRKIVQDLLRAVRPKTVDDNASVFPIARAIQTALDHNKIAIQSGHVGLTLQIDGALKIYADEENIVQAFENLIKNAIEAPNGDAEKHITLEASGFVGTDSRKMIRVLVRDNGFGADSAERWFDPFYTSKDRSQATGLGLSLVKTYIEEVGGSIRVTTGVGKGTTFEMLIPEATQSRMGDSDQEADPVAKGILGIELRKIRKILVVEDLENAIILYEKYLSDAGYEVFGAASGREALELLDQKDHRDRPFDLVLTDYTMPEMNGAEFARAFRMRERQEHTGKQKIPVVMMTGYEAGAKPYDEALGLQAQGVLDGVRRKELNSGPLRDLVAQMKRMPLSTISEAVFSEIAQEREVSSGSAAAPEKEGANSSTESQFILMDSQLRHDINNVVIVFSVIPVLKIPGAERVLKTAQALAATMTQRLRSADNISRTSVSTTAEAAPLLEKVISEYQEISELGDEIANLFRGVEDFPMTDETRGFVRNIHTEQERLRGMIQPFLKEARQRLAAWTAPQIEASTSELASSVASPDAASSHVIRILFADDEDSIRTVFSMLLTMVNNSSPWKLEIDAVESGEKALEAIRTKGVGYYDSVILDNNFNATGKISGMEVGKELREEQAFNGLLILASGAKHEGAENWFSGSLLKPFTGEDLRQLILDPLVAQKERQLAAAAQSRSESRSRLHTAPYGIAKDAESGEATGRSEVRMSLMVRDLVGDATVRTAAELYLMAYERDVYYTSRGISPYTGSRVSSFERDSAREASDGLRSARMALAEAILRRIGTWGFDKIVSRAAEPMESIDILRRSLVEPLWRATTRWPGGKQQDTVLSLMEEQNLANSLSFLRHRSEVRQTAGLWIGVREVAVHGAWFLGGPLLVILWRFGSHGARSVLLEMIDSSSAWLKRRAANALSKDPSSLMPLIDEPGTEDRIFDAAASLVLSGDVSSKAAIIHVLIGMRHRDVRNLPRLSAVFPTVWSRVSKEGIDLWAHFVGMLLANEKNELAKPQSLIGAGRVRARIVLLEDAVQRLSDRAAQINRSEVKEAITGERGAGNANVNRSARDIPRGEAVRTEDSFEVVPAEVSQLEEVLALHNEKWAANKNEHMVFSEKVMRNLIQKGHVYLLRDKDGDRTVRGVLLTHPMQTGGDLEVIRKTPLWKNMIEGNAAEGKKDTVFFWGISVADSRAIPGMKNTGQMFAKLAGQHFLRDLTYVRTFSPVVEKDYDSFRKKLVEEGVASATIEKYGIYFYLASSPEEGPWPYVDHIQRNPFVSPEVFFKSNKRKYRDLAQNFHVGRNGATIIGVLPQKNDFTRPDGPFTAIYGYGPGESDENFKLLSAVSLPEDTSKRRSEVRMLPAVKEIDRVAVERVTRWFRAGILPLRVVMSISREKALEIMTHLGIHQETAVKLSDYLTLEDMRLLEEISGRSLAISRDRTDKARVGGVVFMDAEGLMGFAKNDSLGFYHMLSELAGEPLSEGPIVTAGDSGTTERIAQVLLNKNSGLTLSKGQILKLLDQVIKVEPIRGGQAATINGLAEARRGGIVTILSSEEMLAGLHAGANFAFKDHLAKENVRLVLRTLLGRMRVLAAQLDGASAVDRVKLLEEFNARQVGGLKKIQGGFVFDDILQLVQSFLAQEAATAKSA